MFDELTVFQLQDEEAQLPPGLGGLIKDPIINHGVSSDSSHYYNFRQAISENISPMSVSLLLES